jgi:hypothetical protein
VKDLQILAAGALAIAAGVAGGFALHLSRQAGEDRQATAPAEAAPPVEQTIVAIPPASAPDPVSPGTHPEPAVEQQAEPEAETPVRPPNWFQDEMSSPEGIARRKRQADHPMMARYPGIGDALELTPGRHAIPSRPGAGRG